MTLHIKRVSFINSIASTRFAEMLTPPDYRAGGGFLFPLPRHEFQSLNSWRRASFGVLQRRRVMCALIFMKTSASTSILTVLRDGAPRW